jgi:sulfoxide reductase catalytic subunit YedY
MMFIHKKEPLDPVDGSETPEHVFFNRRKWLATAGLGIGAASVVGYLGWRKWRGSDEAVIAGGQVEATYEQMLAGSFPARLDPRFVYGRAETDKFEAARYTNFYEFSSFKDNWRRVDAFEPYPWTIKVTGLCRNEIRMDLAEFHKSYADVLVERRYRHRCVERWAMAIPWTGIPLARILKDADPLSTATHVRFVSFNRPDQAPQQRSSEYPWPYVEGLTIDEAMNDLTLLTTGVYGRPLIKQHGAPVRLVVPWKYGFKSIKSIDRIEFVDHEPATFWTTLMPDSYPFESNVEPHVPRPWPQDQEWMLGTKEIFDTQLYNGYSEQVAGLYQV